MAYSTTNPPRLILATGLTRSQGVWLYTSTDIHSTVEGSSYFSNATTIGMQLNDLVINQSSSGAVTLHAVTVLSSSSATAPGAATVSAFAST